MDQVTSTKLLYSCVTLAIGSSSREPHPCAVTAVARFNAAWRRTVPACFGVRTTFNGQCSQAGSRGRLVHDKRLPHQTVFPKAGDPRKLCSRKTGFPKDGAPQQAGAGSLPTMMPPRPRFAHGGGRFFGRRVAGTFSARWAYCQWCRHAGVTCGHDREPRLGHTRGC